MSMRQETEGYLARDEVIEKEFDVRGRFSLGGYKVYATDRRLFIIRGNSIRDIDYNHIASIELKEEGSLPAVVVGLVFLVAGFVVMFLGLREWWTWALMGLGLTVFILGLIRTQFVKVVVAGVADAEVLSGYRSGLDALFRIVREKRSMEK
jgi:hypothetical protein